MNNPHVQAKHMMEQEAKRFALFYRWIEENLPFSLLQEITEENWIVLTHSLMDLEAQDYFVPVKVKEGTFILYLDKPHIETRILHECGMPTLQSYRSFTSKASLPFFPCRKPLQIVFLTFSSFSPQAQKSAFLQANELSVLLKKLQEKDPSFSKDTLLLFLQQCRSCFLREVSLQDLAFIVQLITRAQEDCSCRYQIVPFSSTSIKLFIAQELISPHSFLCSLVKMVFRHRLAIQEMNAIHLGASFLIVSLTLSTESISIQELDMQDFIQELTTLDSFLGLDLIEKTFIETGLLRGNLGNLIKTIGIFLYEVLVSFEFSDHSLACIEEDLCRYPNLICSLAQAFEYKFHPDRVQYPLYLEELSRFQKKVQQLNTGNAVLDTRCKAALNQAAYFIRDCLKTNFYQEDKTALCFRIDPSYMKDIPYPVKEKFPELPFALFFMKGPHFFGFHIRFRDLARGGLRTVIPKKSETLVLERNQIFSECYNLAYTQQKKNKDIPEGGAKGVIFLETQLLSKKSLEAFYEEERKRGFSLEETKKNEEDYFSLQQLHLLYAAQKSYIKGLLQLVNTHPDGSLKAERVLDYLKKPEYLYLGPDENMHNTMIDWIAHYSLVQGYTPGIAFISSKPTLGINHKEFGVTSFGVHIYMEETLKQLKINPALNPFTIKMTGGPDGDVAGNLMLYLHRYYPKTARLLTTIDVSGVIFDPNGLDLEELQALFFREQPISHYPKNKLSSGGFLLDTQNKDPQSKVLCTRNHEGTIASEWLLPEEAEYLLRYTIHKTPADVFIPAGGRPRTLHDANIKDFLDEQGHPSAQAIIEGANLYLSPQARRALEELGVLIIKDSSANKGGVICSSFEVLSNLCLTPAEFLKEKPFLAEDILNAIATKSKEEAQLLFSSKQTSHDFLTAISDEISEQINAYTDQIRSCLDPLSLGEDEQDPLNNLLFHYALPTLRNKYAKKILVNVPDIHKKAIIARHLASQLLYQKGLSTPLPLLKIKQDLLNLIEENKELFRLDPRHQNFS